MNLRTKNRNLVLICLIFFLSPFVAQAHSTPTCHECFLPAADRPSLYLPLLKGKNIAVVTNQTGLLRSGKHVVDFLLEEGINVRSIFAPEHGFRGDADAGETVLAGRDKKTGLPIISLYGNNKKPTSLQLTGIDIILFDIQDVGVRFYTYISTLTYVMEAAAENNKKVIVLDRPNPHDGYIDGPVLEEKFSSFVGLHKVPVVYGLTIGEYGMMVNGEKWLKNKVQADYTMIPMRGYKKTQRYDIPVSPSPNLPNAMAINLYPSLCFFEGTNVSVGRGTPNPFQIYGSPYLKDMPYTFTPRPSYGAKDPFLNGRESYGENLTGNYSALFSLNLGYLLKAYRNFDHTKEKFFLPNLFFDKLAGTDKLRHQISAGWDEAKIKESWKKDLEAFEQIRSKYIIYRD